MNLLRVQKDDEVKELKEQVELFNFLPFFLLLNNYRKRFYS